MTKYGNRMLQESKKLGIGVKTYQWNRIGSTEIYLHIHDQLTKEQRQYHGEMTVFPRNSAQITGHPYVSG